MTAKSLKYSKNFYSHCVYSMQLYWIEGNSDLLDGT